MEEGITFTITVDSQDINVRYRPRYFSSVDYVHFEFTSPHEPPRRIPVSETGYRSHFSPIHEIEAAPSVEEYAHALLMALMGMNALPQDECEEEEQEEQLALF